MNNRPTPDAATGAGALTGAPQLQGGGNAANTLTAAARLGLAPVLVTKIGDDSLGDAILAELDADGVDTRFVARAQGAPSPFTYIIVDQSGASLDVVTVGGWHAVVALWWLCRSKDVLCGES